MHVAGFVQVMPLYVDPMQSEFTLQHWPLVSLQHSMLANEQELLMHMLLVMHEVALACLGLQVLGVSLVWQYAPTSHWPSPAQLFPPQVGLVWFLVPLQNWSALAPQSFASTVVPQPVSSGASSELHWKLVQTGCLRVPWHVAAVSQVGAPV
jgi:hypothetical protein